MDNNSIQKENNHNCCINYNLHVVSDDIEIDNLEDLNLFVISDHGGNCKLKSNELSLQDEIKDVEMKPNSNREDFTSNTENSTILNNNKVINFYFDTFIINLIYSWRIISITWKIITITHVELNFL